MIRPAASCDDKAITIIAARSENRVVGVDGKMPWHIPEDLKRFREVTLGHSLIMGSRTFASIGRPLPGRENIVLSQRIHTNQDGVMIADSLKTAINAASLPQPVFVIGGEKPWREALEIASKILLTEVHMTVVGDTYFPEIDEDQWSVTRKEHFPSTETRSVGFSFIEFARA